MRRPWGWMLVLLYLPCCWIKLIRVYPGHRTSLQRHALRAELHIGLSRPLLRYVRPCASHRMTDGLYLEIAYGRPREDDCFRIEDDYGRADLRRL